MVLRSLEEESGDERLEGAKRTLEETRKRALAAYDELGEAYLRSDAEWEAKAAAGRAELVDLFERAEAILTFLFVGSSVLFWRPTSYDG